MAKRFIIAIDLGGTNLRIALLNLNYRIIARESFNTRQFLKRDKLIKAIINSVNKIQENRKLSKSDILGVGLGLPGSVDINKGIVHSLTNIAGWQDVRLGSILKRKLRLPVFMDNDANLMCLAESRLGAARGGRFAVCLTLGTGVGGGIIIDGRLYRGARNATAEIGHMPVNEDGPACNCGGKGCLEAYIGSNRIQAQAKKIFGRSISLEEVSRLAASGNKKAAGLWSAAGEHLGIALVGVVNLLNPDIVVIGGGVANAGKALFDKVKEVIQRRAMKVQAKSVKIFKAKLGNDAGLIGAAVMVGDGARR